MDEWTPTRVEERLRKAVALRDRLPNSDTEFAPGAERIGVIGVIVVNAAGETVVAEAAEALSWLSWLDSDDAGIVIARLDGAAWKAICWRFGISRATAHRRWRRSLRLIACRLEDCKLPAPAPTLSRNTSTRLRASPGSARPAIAGRVRNPASEGV